MMGIMWSGILLLCAYCFTKIMSKDNNTDL